VCACHALIKATYLLTYLLTYVTISMYHFQDYRTQQMTLVIGVLYRDVTPSSHSDPFCSPLTSQHAKTLSSWNLVPVRRSCNTTRTDFPSP